MAKMYTVRTSDGTRTCITVAKVKAKELVKRGKARFLDCSAIQLTPLAGPGESKPKKRYDPTGRDFRGTSAKPDVRLIKSYHRGDLPALAAVDGKDGWTPKYRATPTQSAIRCTDNTKPTQVPQLAGERSNECRN